MPRGQLPVFPEEMRFLNDRLAVVSQGGRVTYFAEVGPVFSHAVEDKASFRMITSQFCTVGAATQAEIARAFGVSKISVLRGVKLFRQQGAAGFFAQRPTRGPAVLIGSVLASAQESLAQGLDVAEVAAQLGLKRNTLAKAVRAGRLRKPQEGKTGP